MSADAQRNQSSCPFPGHSHASSHAHGLVRRQRTFSKSKNAQPGAAEERLRRTKLRRSSMPSSRRIESWMNASELRFRCAVAEQWRRLSSGAIPAGESLVGQTRPSSSLVAQVECYDFLTEYLNLKYLLRGQSDRAARLPPGQRNTGVARRFYYQRHHCARVAPET